MSEFSQAEIRKFITSILTTGNVLRVDDDGIIHWNDETQEVVTINIEGGKGILHTYTTTAKHPDAVIVCPIAESLTISMDRQWFYKITTNILQQQLIKIITLFITLVGNSSDPEQEIYPSVLPYLKNIISKVDDKTLGEFMYLVNTYPKDILSVVYNNKAKECKIFSGLEDPSGEFQKAIPVSKVRKKSWTVFQDLLRSIFQSTGPVNEEYRTTTCMSTCPHFRTYMELWVKCWKAYSPILTVTEPDAYEELESILDDISVHMERIDVYYKMCQWFTQMSATKSVKSNVQKSVAAPKLIKDTSLTPAPVGMNVETEEQHQPQKSKWDTPKGNGLLIGNSHEIQKISLPSQYIQSQQNRDPLIISGPILQQPMIGQPTIGYQPIGMPLINQQPNQFIGAPQNVQYQNPLIQPRRTSKYDMGHTSSQVPQHAVVPNAQVNQDQTTTVALGAPIHFVR